MPPTAELLAKYGTKLAVQGGTEELLSKYGSGEEGPKKKVKPGEHWSVPLQEQHPDVNRFFLMNFESATPETMGRALAENFEVRHRGGLDFSIRKPGEKKWRVVDPRTWSDWIPFWGGDWSDLAGDLFTGVLSGAGGTIGAATGTGLLPGGGTVKGAMAGAAAGAAVAETAKQLVGKLLGGGASAGEIAQSVGTEAVLGGVSEPIAQFAAPVVRGALGKAKTALFGNAPEATARNLAAREAAAKAGVSGAVPQEKVVEGVLPAITRKGETLADDIALREATSAGELMALPEGELRSRAAQQGIRLSEDVPVSDIQGALTKQAEQDLAAEARRIRGRISMAENVQTRPLSKKVVEEMTAKAPQLRTLAPKQRNAAIRQMLLDEIPLLEKQLERAQGAAPRVSKQEVSALKEGIGKGDQEALEEAARLGVDIPEASAGTLARRVLEKETTRSQRAALGRQVDRRLRELDPYEPVEIEHILARKSEELGLPAGELRTYEGTLKPEIDLPSYRAAEAEIKGMSLDEAQRHLQDIGWTGPTPNTMEGVVDKIYARRYLGLVGGADRTAGAARTLPLFDPAAEVTPWHKARKDLITEIRAGGETFRPGPANISAGNTAAAAAARWASKPANWVGRKMQTLGGLMQLPAKGGHAVAGAVLGRGGAEAATRRAVLAGGTFGAGLVTNPAVAGAIGAGIGLDILGRGVASVGRKLAADDSGQALIRLASSAPENVARWMWPVVEKLRNRGVRSYRAGLYAMMHNPEVRHYLRKNLEEKDLTR